MTKLKDSKIDFLQQNIYTGVIKPNSFTTAELNALYNPQTGWIAEDSTKNALMRYDGATWRVISSSSSGSGPFDALVGPNQDYTTVKAAVDAGKSTIAVVADTTETANIVLGESDYVIYLFESWSVGPYNIDCTGANYFNIVGSDRGAYLETVYNTSKQFLINTQNLLSVQFSNISIQHTINTPGVTSLFPANDYDFALQLDNVLFLCYSTEDNSYLNLKNTGSIASNLYLQGGNAGHGKILKVSEGATVSGFSYTGNGKATSGNTHLIEVTGSTMSDGIISGDGTLTRQIEVGASAIFSDIRFYTPLSAPYNMRINGGQNNINNIIGNNGDILFTSRNNNSFSNVQFFGNASTFTMNDSFTTITNCQLHCVLNIEGNYNIITSNIIGQNGSIGSNDKIDIKSGSTKNIVTSNATDLAVTDSGSGSQVANNIVF